eukprot:TRINITY_DN3114_c0_g1_i1.p1 TRINITY_DN3114_c0_g1~~TRINITY_DN3114_c0_g1_i1.p1  ORF type:complete len:224 (-),score=19.83 TRINITY_DN3114_c0_g1_i1:76-747(-)
MLLFYLVYQFKIYVKVMYQYIMCVEVFFFFFQAEDGIRDVERSRGLGDVYKRQALIPLLVSTQSTWESFEAQIIVFRHPGHIKPGYSPIIYCHTAQVACKFATLKSRIEKHTNKVVEAFPKFLRQGDCAIVQIVPLKPLCVETFKNYPALGRFVVRDLRRTVAVGVVRSVEKVKGIPTTIESTIKVEEGKNQFYVVLLCPRGGLIFCNQILVTSEYKTMGAQI